MDQKNNPYSESGNAAEDVFEQAAIGLAYINLGGRFLRTNPALQDMLGYTNTVMCTLLIDEIVHPDDLKMLSSDIQALKDQTHTRSTLNLRFFNSIGGVCKVHLNLSVMHNEQGLVTGLIAAVENIDQKNTVADDPLINRKLFETIAENVPTTVWLSSIDMKTVHFANQAFLDTWNITRDMISSGKSINILDRIHPDDVEDVRNLLLNRPTDNDSWEQSFRILNDNGSVSYIEDHGTILRNDAGQPVYLLGTHHDVTERVKYTAELENLNQELQKAYEDVTRINQFDSLTGCFNRLAMLDHLSNSYYQFTRYDIPSSIIYIDLNQFKHVNDDHGHNAGDMVLKNFVSLMQKRIRQSDILGRMGGDEFLLLLPGTTQQNAEQFLKKENKEFTTKIDLVTELILSYAVGVSELEFNMKSTDEWIDAADQAMYQQKAKNSR